MIQYKVLDTEFVKSGFRFRQLRREGDTAIFHKAGLKGNLHPVDFDAGFEVVSITRHDGYEIAGVKMEPAESYPSPEMWGTRGWTYTNLLAAENKYDALLGRKIAKVEPVEEATEATETTSTRGRARGERPTLNYPTGEFSVKELAELNKVEYPIAFVVLKEQEEAGLVKRTRLERRNVKGKPTQLFEKVS